VSRCWATKAPPLFTAPADTRKVLKGVKTELDEARRRYGVLDMAHRALKVSVCVCVCV
jgi:hypothetical protein